MAVQLGLDGGAFFTGKVTRADMKTVLDLSLPRYRRWVYRITHPTEPMTVYWRIVFSILSVHTSFEANEAAYLELRKRPRMPRSWRTLTGILTKVRGRDGTVVQFPGQKAKYLLAFDEAWQDDADRFMPNGDKPEGWRDRIDDVPGLARMKASFAVCLSDPLGSSVVCIDRHMARLLLGVQRERQLRKKEYDRAERVIKALARAYKAPPFAVQWCLWDAQRRSQEPHRSLRAA